MKDDDKGDFVTGGFTGNLARGDEIAGLVSLPESFIFGESICDPVQDAITSTEIACRTAEGLTLKILQHHLKRLVDLQYYQLTPEEAEPN